MHQIQDQKRSILKSAGTPKVIYEQENNENHNNPKIHY